MRWLGIGVLAVLLVSCDLADKVTDSSPDTSPDPADAEGNLAIRNATGAPIVLYNGDTRLKIIPDNQTNYLVNVPNPNAAIIDLRVYRLSDIEGDLSSPDPALAFKRWLVPLASDAEAEHRSTWIVSAKESDTGTISMSYVGGTDNFVEVFLNGRTGAAVAALRPGASATQIGVDFDIYTVHYRYWASDPNSGEAETELGWRETETVNDEEVPIYVVLNEGRQTRNLQIPHFGDAHSLWGSVRVVNSTARPVRIWVGSDLIEQIVHADGSRTNLSTITANESTVFVLPVGEFHLIAKDPVTNAEVGSVDVVVTEDLDITWDVSSGEVSANIVISGTLPE